MKSCATACQWCILHGSNFTRSLTKPSGHPIESSIYNFQKWIQKMIRKTGDLPNPSHALGNDIEVVHQIRPVRNLRLGQLLESCVHPRSGTGSSSSSVRLLLQGVVQPSAQAFVFRLQGRALGCLLVQVRQPRRRGQLSTDRRKSCNFVLAQLIARALVNDTRNETTRTWQDRTIEYFKGQQKRAVVTDQKPLNGDNVYRPWRNTASDGSSVSKVVQLVQLLR